MTDQKPVAIIGMGCLFPKSTGLKQYWKLLFQGEDAITEIPASHWSASEYFDSDPKRPDHVYCKRGGFLAPVQFDPSEFGIPPNSLEATDTSQLLGLMTAKMALEDCGYGNDREFDRDRTAVILGVTGTQELVIPLSSRLGHPKWRKALLDSAVPPDQAEEVIRKISDSYVSWQENSFPGLLGNVVAGRICNRLDLRGTNCVVDAACASSLSAVHLGLLELESGRSDMVVTGGVDTLNDIFMQMCFSKTGTLSATGDARPFSKDADGTVLGEGIGMLVLKRLESAEADGDRIYAVIRGLGSSSDGRSQSIYAPRSQGQARALRAAYQNAGISPTDVQLIEAHGTGTRVGDKVEFEALNQVFGEFGANGNKCALGSVKSMIGHTKASAGAAGLIKAALGLYHKVLPPTLKAAVPDPALDIDNSHFYLNTTSRPWLSNNGTPRRAGVSAFGFGGSNFHVVLEEYSSEKTEISWDGSVEIVSFSAARPRVLAEDVAKFLQALEYGQSEHQFAVAAAESRRRFSADGNHRLLVVSENPGQCKNRLTRVLEMLAAGNIPNGLHQSGIHIGGPHAPDKLAFVFPGQGSQYVGMGRDIVCTFPRALEVLRAANTRSEGRDLLSDLIFPPPANDPQHRISQETSLRKTDHAQPGIGAISLAMLNVLQEFGIAPDAACGHSFGELTALCAAGWITEDAYLDLATLRGQLMAAAGVNQDSPPGAMLAVRAPLDEIEGLLAESNSKVVLANRNSPDQGVLSGPTDDIREIEQLCQSRKFSVVRLPVSAAFHSQQLEGAVQPFFEALEKIPIEPSAIDVFSNTSADFYPVDPDEIRRLLSQQLIHPVDFTNEIERMYAAGIRTFVEIGPKTVLTGLISANLRKRPFEALAMDASRGKASGVTDLAHLLCRLAALGHPVKLKKWEKPLPPLRHSRMQVQLNGANYFSPKPPAAKQTSKAGGLKTDVGKQASEPKRQMMKKSEKDTYLMSADDQAGPKPEINETMENDNQNPSELFHDAYRVVAEGLKAMQRLQSQTAEAHQKFLETQAEANRSLREMMKCTQHLAGQPPGVPRQARHSEAPQNSPRRQLAPVATPNGSISRDPGAPVSELMPTAIEVESAAPSPAGLNSPHAAANGYCTDLKPHGQESDLTEVKPGTSISIEPILLEVVSRLTGYPQEMLGLDMDIEAELGIDSIKRVEILSGLEKAIPDLPAVSPDMMGSLKTLGQILDHFSQSGPGRTIENQTNANVPEASSSMSGLPSETGTNPGALIESTLLEVVSQLTGYPTEMLGLDMDIEAELGIDSIKRVEILSTLEEKLPNLPPVSPDMMGTLKTLGQIAQFLNGGEPDQSGKKTSDPKRPAQSAIAFANTGASTADADRDLKTAMLDVVSRLTGYPVDMLGMEMDIEAELGIDSIKRVEIMSTLEEEMPGLPAVSPDVMGTLKTLGQIADYFTSTQAPNETPDTIGYEPVQATLADSGAKPEANIQVPAATTAPDISALPRHGLIFADAPPISGKPVTVSGSRKVFVTEDRTGLSEEITEELAKLNIRTVKISLDILNYKKQLPEAAGLIIVQDPKSENIHQDLEDAFTLSKHLAPDLIASALESGAVFATITRLDGAFGLKRHPIQQPVQAGLAGLAKTAAIEWENVCCHAIDIDPKWMDNRAVASAVVREIMLRGPVEIGLDLNSRISPVLKDIPVPTGDINLNPEDTVVISGGARGVTAAAALELARHTGCRMVLLGRSPEPVPEPAWLSGLKSEADMKKAILENEYRSQHTTLPAIEAAFRGYAANREIARNLNDLRATGSDIHYFSVDVRDSDATVATINKIRTNVGPISAVIHGAGVLEDRLITDKSTEQFRRVYDTKVKGLENLLRATRQDRLKHLVFFSSVAARMGNRGQVDYAMANEVLNKVAWDESNNRLDCRVKSINWGPWDGGMVTAALKREFERNGIYLIPVEAGAKAMLREMADKRTGPVEVVIGAELPASATQTPDVPKRPALVKPAVVPYNSQPSLTFEREVDIEQYPVLQSHVIDGKPVVPLALMTEWLAHGALHENPGLILQGLNDVRVMKGIRLEQRKTRVQLLAGKSRQTNGRYEVEVEIRDARDNGRNVTHARATAILSEERSPAPEHQFSKTMVARAYSRNMEEVYDRILFHGRGLQGIDKIVSCSARGMMAHISTAPAPEDWMTSPLRNQWIADPLALDSAFQMATVWCFEEKGLVSLPSYIASYRQYCDRFPADMVTVVLEISAAENRKMQGNFIFLDANDTVIASLNGYECIMDASLLKAFKPQYRASA